MKLARHIELHDAREGNEAVEHGTPVTTSQSEPGGGLANTREGQMELLPCPFCGKTPILSSRPGINHCGRDWSIQCATPGCFNFVTTSSRYRSELIATWNKRPPSLPAVPDVKEEEKTLEEPRDVAANTRQGQTELLGVVKAAYLKHHCGLDNVGWDALGDMMQNALCNTMGDTEFQRWLEENTNDTNTGN
jgi:hypothetical protein